MNEKYVTSLELSKLLKEKGVPQRSEFWWFENRRFVKYDSKKWKDEFSKDWGIIDFRIEEECISAYLSDELLNLIVNSISGDWGIWWNEGWHCQTYRGTRKEDGYPQIFEGDKNVTTCLTKMLLYLLDNNIIKAGELK